MTSIVRVRAAEPADAALLCELIAELAVYERLEDQVRASAGLLTRHLFGEQPCAEAAIAELDGQPTGYALWFPTFSTFAGRPGIWLEDLFVRPQQRRAGSGRMLLAHVARVAAVRGCSYLDWAVLDWNEPALSFYASLGARRHAEWIPHRLDGVDLERLAVDY